MTQADLTLAGMAILPLVIGLTNVIKEYLPARYTPLIALALGLILGLFAEYTTPHPVLAAGVAEGIAIGLAAVGLYEAVNHLAQQPEKPPGP